MKNLFYILPDLTSYDQGDKYVCNPESRPEFALQVQPGAIQLPYLSHILFGQSLATAVTFTPGSPLFVGAIAAIDFMCTFVEMIWADAWRVVTFVTYKSIWRITSRKTKAYSVSTKGTPFVLDLSVPIFVSSARPYPTRVGFENFRPEVVCKRFVHNSNPTRLLQKLRGV